MSILKAENRDQSLKAKKLRKSGIVPGCVYGSNLEKTLLLQIPEADAKKFLKTNSVGCKVTLDVEGNKINALLKEISMDNLGNQIEHLCFQSLVAGEKVMGTAQIVLLNRDKVAEFIQQSLFEISYKAVPSHLIEKVEIDLEGMKAGDCVRIEDLDLAKDEDIELVTAPDSMILTIVENKRTPAGTEEEAAAE
ncbi:MAG: 50S ribosomal protein L25 [Clostridiales bacterium]|jgi:large subunit ribosomal protein L25|nr:50S ribosomal protein L25 [Clostridiales bacterium]